MPDDLASLETADDPWSAHEGTVQATGFLAMLRELPALWVQVFREAWQVNRSDTLVMVVTTIVAEIFTAVGLLATTGVLEQLLAEGPTPDRVRDATPALLLVVGSIVVRAALREAGSWAGARLDPQLDRVTTTRLLELTTQVELVAYDDGPQVSYGGLPGREIDLDRLRAHIAVIAQDFTHWPFTARENITLGAPEPPDAARRFAEATRSSGARDVCDRLEHGYDTLLDPSFKGGTELSGGQWQRIAVARGLYRDAPLLICDEPTAALDARSEHLIFEAIRRHALQRTVVLITHRLASVRYADRIFVLDQGRIVERGTHTELMALGGIYAEFYGLQASAYEQVP